MVDKHKVNIFYTAPTAIRALMREGEEPVKKTCRKSLRLLGTVGEPINPEAWEWYYRVVGEERCPIVDTWWQTETGGILITPLPGAIDAQAGLGDPAVLRRQAGASSTPSGKVLEGAGRGQSVHHRLLAGPDAHRLRRPRALRPDLLQRPIPASYFTGDGCRRDEDGYYWITGRVDDVINVSGHRMGTAEVESALVAHPKVAEAAVVGFPHDIKGQGIYAYVTLNAGEEPSDELRKELIALGAQGDRPDRHARRHPVGAGPAQDPLGQDHAPHPAQDRRERVRQPRRHLHPGRSGGGARPGEQPERVNVLIAPSGRIRKDSSPRPTGPARGRPEDKP